jgi:hypothetical protein
MTSVRITPASRNVRRIPPDDHERLRLDLKPEAPATGAVDGGWWPHARDLAAEAPALLAALTARLGTVEGVSYNLDDWGATRREITIDGARVRLAGYRSQHRDTIDVYSRRRLVTLLVVAPEATAPHARAALRAAADRANTDGVEALLLAPPARSVDDAADQRSEIDGAAVHSPEGA